MLLTETKAEWRAAEQSYHRSLLFAAAVYVVAELTGSNSSKDISIFGIQNISPGIYVRSACILLGFAFYWNVSSYHLAHKLSSIHYEVAMTIHSALKHERLYEAIATSSLLTRGTTTVESVDSHRQRGPWRDFVQVGFPNVLGFFGIPLLLLALCGRVFLIDVANFGFDAWFFVALVATVTLLVMGGLRAFLEFDEAIDEYGEAEG